MLLKVFKTSFLFQYVLLIILAGVLWSVSFFSLDLSEPDTNSFLTPGYALLKNLIGANSIIGKICAWTIIVLGAFLINYILPKFGLIQKNTLIAGLVYIVIMSHSTDMLYFHQAIVPSFLLLIVLFFLFQVYTATEAYSQVFNSGFLIAISSFFYFPSIYLIVVVWLSFIVFRLYYWREWLIVLFGFITPYIFLYTYYFWFDEIPTVFNSYANYFSNINFFMFDIQFSIVNYVSSAILVVLILWSVFIVAGDLNEKIISVRKRYWILFWLFIIALLTDSIAGSLFRLHQVLIFIPASAFIAYGFLRSRKTFWLDIIFTLLVLLIMIKNFQNIL